MTKRHRKFIFRRIFRPIYQPLDNLAASQFNMHQPLPSKGFAFSESATENKPLICDKQG
jgi:hypothetical protein